MPAKGLIRVSEKDTYSHVYNKGVEGRVIFNDEQDYEVFIGYLRDYLSAPLDPENTKKNFTVNGRTYKGTPHLPKNYFNKVELISYSLMPDHFHLVLYQTVEGSVESFIRSLCTRYSMYFNKKYQRSGALFVGPYKSAEVKDTAKLAHLTAYIHHNSPHSSLLEYTGDRATSWVKTKVVLSFFDDHASCRDFMEKYDLARQEKDLLGRIVLESGIEHLEGRVLDENPASAVPHTRAPELIAFTIVFLVLTTLGLRNINVSANEAPKLASIPEEPPQVFSASTETESPEEPEEEEIKRVVVIKALGEASINLRLGPNTDSEKVGTAKDGDTFGFVSLDSNWYKIQLEDGAAYVSAEYAEMVEEKL